MHGFFCMLHSLGVETFPPKDVVCRRPKSMQSATLRPHSLPRWCIPRRRGRNCFSSCCCRCCCGARPSVAQQYQRLYGTFTTLGLFCATVATTLPILSLIEPSTTAGLLPLIVVCTIVYAVSFFAFSSPNVGIISLFPLSLVLSSVPIINFFFGRVYSELVSFACFATNAQPWILSLVVVWRCRNRWIRSLARSLTQVLFAHIYEFDVWFLLFQVAGFSLCLGALCDLERTPHQLGAIICMWIVLSVIVFFDGLKPFALLAFHHGGISRRVYTLTPALGFVYLALYCLALFVVVSRSGLLPEIPLVHLAGIEIIGRVG